MKREDRGGAFRTVLSVGESLLIIMLISHVLHNSVTQIQCNPVSQPNKREKSPGLVLYGHGTQSLVTSQRALN